MKEIVRYYIYWDTLLMGSKEVRPSLLLCRRQNIHPNTYGSAHSSTQGKHATNDGVAAATQQGLAYKQKSEF